MTCSACTPQVYGADYPGTMLNTKVTLPFVGKTLAAGTILLAVGVVAVVAVVATKQRQKLGFSATDSSGMYIPRTLGSTERLERERLRDAGIERPRRGRPTKSMSNRISRKRPTGIARFKRPLVVTGIEHVYDKNNKLISDKVAIQRSYTHPASAARFIAAQRTEERLDDDTYVKHVAGRKGGKHTYMFYTVEGPGATSKALANIFKMVKPSLTEVRYAGRDDFYDLGDYIDEDDDGEDNGGVRPGTAMKYAGRDDFYDLGDYIDEDDDGEDNGGVRPGTAMKFAATDDGKSDFFDLGDLVA